MSNYRFTPRSAGNSGGEDNSWRYVPPPSVGHEIGVMIGGIVAMLLGMLLFWVWWTFHLKREERAEKARVEQLRQRGILKEQLAVTENTGKEKAAEAA